MSFSRVTKFSFTDCFSECNLFEKKCVICLPLNLQTYLLWMTLAMIHIRRFYFRSSIILSILFCKMRLKGVGKEELIAEHVQFLNQIDSDETRSNYLKPQGRIYCLYDRGHGVLMLYIEFVGWTSRFIRLWPNVLFTFLML